MRRFTLLFGIAVCTVIVAPSNSTAETTDSPAPVEVQALGKKFQLVGRLGKSLGEVITITAKIEEENEKHVWKNWLTVVSVNGQAIETPTSMHVHDHTMMRIN